MAELDVNALSVGSIFYGVKTESNAFHRKKIYREIDGEQWFKYDKPPMSHNIVTYTVIGVLEKTLSGEWELGSEYELDKEIFVVSEIDGKTNKYTMFVNDVDSDKCFLDKEEAMTYIESLYKKDKEVG